MNTILWVIQSLLALVFTLSGVIVYINKNKLATKLSWLNEYSSGMVFFICFSKIAGAIGLILPMYFNLFPILTPIAAFGIAIIMILAMRYHIQKKEYKDIPATVIFLLLSLFVIYGRFRF